MPHELTHVIFHELVRLNDLVPTWFDEGLAVYNQTYHEPEMQQRFNDALKTHSLLRLDTLADGFPANSDKAYLAYAESWQFMSYMYNTFGITKMAHLIHLMNTSSGAFEYEMTSAFGKDSTQIENQWLISLNQPPILPPTQSTQPTAQPSHKVVVPLVTTTDATAPWLIGAGVLLILLSLSGVSGLFVYQRRRTRFGAQSLALSTTQTIQHQPARPAHTPPVYVPPTPDAFEQYTQPTIPYVDAPNYANRYTSSPSHNLSFPAISPSEQFDEQPDTTLKAPLRHNLAALEEQIPPFTSGQEYKVEQVSEQQKGLEGTDETNQTDQTEPSQHQQYQAPQE